MIPSAILGAAAGTGVALFLAVTLVVFRYYSHRRRAREWNSIDQNARKSIYAACTEPSNEFVVTKEIIQPPLPPPLCRTPSASSASSLESAPRPAHRGSSPAIRTFAPDGRAHPEAAHAASCPLRAASRSPSPLRAASLDAREEARTPSPASPRLGRCLSPLLIPARQPEAAPPASPLGAIQPDLYVRKDGPMFIGGAAAAGASLGRLHFRLKYDFDRSDLVVHLIEAHDLAGSEQGGFNDPYVRLALSPEVDARKRQTTIRRNDPNPFFDQHFKFPISHDDLQTKSLVLQVFDYDRYSRNDVIGEVSMRMEEFDVASNVEVWGEITKNRKPPEEMQEILVSLSYLPSAERLTVVLLKARNLVSPQEKESIDPFVKVYLLVNGKRIKKKKTAARKGNCNPVWNEALSFSLSASNLANAAIEVNIMDQGTDLIGTNPLIGCCLLGPKETGPERDHWLDMTQSLRKAVACWHTMR